MDALRKRQSEILERVLKNIPEPTTAKEKIELFLFQPITRIRVLSDTLAYVYGTDELFADHNEVEQLLKSIRTFYDNVTPEELAILNTAVPEKFVSAPRRVDRSGYVYLLKQVNGTLYKIGRTKNPKVRSKTFGISLPFEVSYECWIRCSDMIATEKELHNKFSLKRKDTTEWFALSNNDVVYIKGLVR